MRIVIDLQACQSNGSRTRGIGRYSLSLAKAMARNAGPHEIRLMLSGLFPDTIAPLRQEFAGLVAHEHIHVWHAPAEVADIASGSGWRRRSGELIREQALAELRPDMVHVSSLFEGLSDDALTSIGNSGEPMPTAVTLYDLIPLINAKPYLENPQVREWYYRKVQGIKNADLLLAISESSRQEGLDWLQLPKDRVVNISSAVDERFRVEQYSADQMQALRQRYGLLRPFVMYTGGIDLRKNIEALIRSYAALPSSLRQQYQLAIVCSVQPHDRERLQKLAAQSGLAPDEMILTGFVPDEDLPLLYNLCSLFVFPSWHEGFGLPALEAMACGAPVIAANTSSLPEVIGREDALFDPHSDAAISAKMHQALTDEAWSGQLRAHGLQQAGKFSWDASAKRAISAFEEQHARRQSAQKTFVATRDMVQRKPKLAYFSPLPPERSGIADYSAELLPELSRFYDIELIVDQKELGDSWLNANFPMRSWQWFEQHAERFDRVLYNFGNSAFHTHMFDLLKRHPGVVVLHDFFLSGILSHLELCGDRPDSWWHILYESHGYAALIDRLGSPELRDVILKYPCSLPTIRRAEGVIVHSSFSMQLAREWYGKRAAGNWTQIPHLRRPIRDINRQAAREKLQLQENDFLLCSFGILGLPKLNHRLLQAWLKSPMAQDANCQLVFVGENDAGEYGVQLLADIAASPFAGRIKITGFADHDLFRTYLAAADAAVQLRGFSRGETSGTVLDCMAHGVPCIVNDNGSMKELPSHTLIKLDDDFEDNDLRDSLMALRSNPVLRADLAKLALHHIEVHHAPEKVGALYFEAIENYFQNEPASKMHRSLRKVAEINALEKPTDSDLIAVAKSLSLNSESYITTQVLLDIGFLVQPERLAVTKPGSMELAEFRQRVGNLIASLAELLPRACRLEPVMATKSGLHYARRLSSELLGIPAFIFTDDVVEVKNSDLYLDLAGHLTSVEREQFLRQLSISGARYSDLSQADGSVWESEQHVRQWATKIVAELGCG